MFLQLYNPSGLEGSKSLIYFHLTRRTFLIFKMDLSFVTVWNIMLDNMRKKTSKRCPACWFWCIWEKGKPKIWRIWSYPFLTWKVNQPNSISFGGSAREYSLLNNSFEFLNEIRCWTFPPYFSCLLMYVLHYFVFYFFY